MNTEEFVVTLAHNFDDYPQAVALECIKTLKEQNATHVIYFPTVGGGGAKYEIDKFEELVKGDYIVDMNRECEPPAEFWEESTSNYEEAMSRYHDTPDPEDQP